MKPIIPWTVEDVDGHLDQHSELLAMAIVPQKFTGAELCATWVAVRPVLATVASFPFFPQRWRDAICVLIRVVDAACPGPALTDAS